MFNRKQRRIDYLEDQIISAYAETDRWQDNYRALIDELDTLVKRAGPTDKHSLKDLVRDHMSRLPAGS
jgi:hypothetical protein